MLSRVSCKSAKYKMLSYLLQISPSLPPLYWFPMPALPVCLFLPLLKFQSHLSFLEVFTHTHTKRQQYLLISGNNFVPQ